MADDSTITSGRVRTGLWRALFALGATGGLAALGKICYSLGLEVGRIRAGGGMDLARTMEVWVGILATIAVGIVALILMHRSSDARSIARSMGWLLVAAIAVGWASWLAGGQIGFGSGV